MYAIFLVERKWSQNMKLNRQAIKSVLKYLKQSRLTDKRASIKISPDILDLSENEAQVIGDNVPYAVIEYYSKRRVII